MADTESSSSTPRASTRAAKPHTTLLRLGLAPLIVHFRSTTGYIAPSTLESYDGRILGRIKGDTAKVEDVRYVKLHVPRCRACSFEPVETPCGDDDSGEMVG
jgi:hypothetical protein